VAEQRSRRIFLVRHGETEWSLAGKHTSRTDLGLTEAGRSRAARLRDFFAERPFSVVVSSPLRRALETCELAGLRDRAVIDEDLREWDYGDYEGLTTPEIRQSNPDWMLWRDGCPGGESPAQVGARADRALAALRDALGSSGSSEPEGDAVAFAHGHILRVLGARWIEMEVAAGSRLALSAGAVCELGYERDTPVLRLWNGGPSV
jgi:probable phosphoglycerate mutase